jgi:hypothetical protein
VVFEVGVEEFEVVPDFPGLVVAAVCLALENCDIGLCGKCLVTIARSKRVGAKQNSMLQKQMIKEIVNVPIPDRRSCSRFARIFERPR